MDTIVSHRTVRSLNGHWTAMAALGSDDCTVGHKGGFVVGPLLRPTPDTPLRYALRRQPRSLNSLSIARPMIIFWISAVPSPISSIGASRYRRSISYSLLYP